MRAVWYDRLGDAEAVLTYGELPTPIPGRGEVLIRVHASGVNPADVKRRAGSSYGMEFPRIIPNSDGAGVVEQLGDDVDPSWLSRRVWLFNGQRGRAFGTAAEFITLPVWQLALLPDDLSMAEGACLGIPCMTAHRCVFADGPVTGRRVLVAGGAGAVGHYAVQWAKYGGASQVIATVSSPAKANEARAAGADVVVNYRDGPVAAAIMDATGGAGIDRAIEVDLGGNLDATLACLAPGGSIATYASTGPLASEGLFFRLARQNIGLRFVMLYSVPRLALAHAQADIGNWLATGTAIHRVALRFPLAQTAAAHRAVEAGEKLGTVVVEPIQPKIAA
jgi:NADPH2:quinone reductase